MQPLQKQGREGPVECCHRDLKRHNLTSWVLKPPVGLRSASRQRLPKLEVSWEWEIGIRKARFKFCLCHLEPFHLDSLNFSQSYSMEMEAIALSWEKYEWGWSLTSDHSNTLAATNTVVTDCHHYTDRPGSEDTVENRTKMSVHRSQIQKGTDVLRMWGIRSNRKPVDFHGMDLKTVWGERKCSAWN